MFFMMIQFIGLRYLNEKKETRDPFLGRRFTLHVLLNVSIFMTLIGMNTLLFALVETVIGKDDGNFLEVPLRTGAAITFAGGMYVILLIALLVLFMQDAKYKTVHHSFVILRFMMSGAVVMAITTQALISVFSSSDKSSGSTALMSFTISVFLVWVPMALLHFVWLRILLLKKKKKQELAS